MQTFDGAGYGNVWTFRFDLPVTPGPHDLDCPELRFVVSGAGHTLAIDWGYAVASAESSVLQPHDDATGG